jgi:hypothetical protein
MIVTASDAKARLEANGLYVSARGSSSLWIAGTVHDAGDGVIMSNDACSLIANAGGWVAVFPAEGLCTYELPGTLEELVATICAVYDQSRRGRGSFADAFRQVVRDADRYVIGRSLARA